MAIRKPKHVLHPGEILREIYMKDIGLDVSMLPENLKRIIECKDHITSTIAKQLAGIFNTSPELWLKLQADYDNFNE